MGTSVSQRTETDRIMQRWYCPHIQKFVLSITFASVRLYVDDVFVVLWCCIATVQECNSSNSSNGIPADIEPEDVALDQSIAEQAPSMNRLETVHLIRSSNVAYIFFISLTSFSKFSTAVIMSLSVCSTESARTWPVARPRPVTLHSNCAQPLPHSILYLNKMEQNTQINSLL